MSAESVLGFAINTPEKETGGLNGATVYKRSFSIQHLEGNVAIETKGRDCRLVCLSTCAGQTHQLSFHSLGTNCML